MAEMIPVSVREANQEFSRLVARVETRGDGFLITKRGRPVARLVPVTEEHRGVLTPEQREALDELLGEQFHLGGERLDRDELHER